MNDIMVSVRELYVPHRETLVLAEWVVELCGVSVLVYCHFMYSSRVCYRQGWRSWGEGGGGQLSP